MASALSFSSRVSNASPLVADHRAAAGAPRSRASTPGAPLVVRPCALLETKSLAELRALARERGLRGDTRSELLKLLSSNPSASNGASNGAPRASPQSGTYDVRTLQTMPMAQLRAMARARGVQGETREDIIRRLTAAGPGPSASSPKASAPSSSSFVDPPNSPVGASSVSTFSRQQLLSKTLPALRALARTKGVPNAAGATKEQLVQALASPSTGAPPAASSAPAAPAWTPPPAPSAPAAPAAPKASGTVKGSSVPLSDLQVMTLGQLRALGKQYGIRGDTKAELIALLSSSSPSAKPAAAPAAAAPKRTATAVAEPQTLPAAETSLPPFQSVVSTSAALEPVKLASEVSALRKAMEDMEARDKLLEQERQSLVEQADFLRNVLVGGIGLAAVPLLLPFQNAFSPSASTNNGVPSPPPATTTSLVIPSAAPAPAKVPSAPAAPAPPPAPVVKEVSPEDYCGSVPSALLSPQVAKFCEALIEPTF